MTQARNSLRQVAFVPETTFGATPGGAQTQLLEWIDFNPTFSASDVVDPSINAFRQTTSTRRGNVSAGATLNVALCPDNYDIFLAGLMMQNDWTTNVLKVGTVANAVRKSFAIEEGFTDLAQYHVFNGMVVNSARFNFPSDDSYVTAEFEFLGTTLTDFTGTSIDSTPTAVTPKGKFFHEGGTIEINGAAAGWVTSMELEVNNNYSQTYTFGSTSAFDVPFGNADTTGRITGVFNSVTEWERYKDGTATSIEVTVVSGAEQMIFLLPQVIYTNGSIVASGDAGITVEFEFRAEYNTTEATSFKITRV